MKKLFNLKEWLTTQEAAKYLSILFNEDVSEADVLRLGLDGHLTLSVNFVNHARGRIADLTPMNEAKMYVMPLNIDKNSTGQFIQNVRIDEIAQLPDEIQTGLKSGSLILSPMGVTLNENEVLQYRDTITSLTGIWDLPMIGAERLDVEHMYQQLTGGPEVTLTCLDGVFVKTPDGWYANLQESFDNNEYQHGSLARLEDIKKHITEDNIEPEKAQSLLEQHKEDRKKFLEQMKQRPDTENHYPAGTLPEDSVIVVRTDYLRAFEESTSDNPTKHNKPLHPNERVSLLVVIAALCDHAAINPSERGAAVQIAKMTEKLGAPVSDDTIRRVLDKIENAVESRMK